MQVHTVQPAGWLQLAVPLLLAAIVMAARARRMRRARPLRLERLWVVPALYGAMVVASFVAAPPGAQGWAVCAAALAIGAALGWQRGRTMRITVDPDTHALNQQASPAALLFVVALIAVKAVARAEGEALHLDVALLTDALLALALGMFTAMRVEIYLRATQMLDTARADRAAS